MSNKKTQMQTTTDANAQTQRNPAQEKVIETLPGPLFVSAGAGSGKTWTLTQRIGGAFQVNKSDFKLKSITEVLAITFTKKAAAELLSRIKAKLIEVQNEYPELGLSADDINVNASWISTIHGFCSRFLKENALEIGLDPDFKMLSELEAEELMHEARERVLKKIRSGEIDILCFGNKWRPFGASAFDEGLLDCADALRCQALGMRNGFEDVAQFEVDDTENIITTLIVAVQKVLSHVEHWEDAPTKTESGEIDKLASALENANKFSETGEPNSLIAAINIFPKLRKDFGKKESKGGTELYEDLYREPRRQAFAQVYGACGVEQSQALIAVAKALHEEFDSLKRAANVLDDTDLLRRTLEALDAHPELQEKCRNTYKLIMIDEFQDTDKVQVAILELIAAPKLANVCVVGDAQQSIYRFRGADVKTFFEYFANLKQLHGVNDDAADDIAPKLERNYRSHADVLDFVECIFSRNGKFVGTDVDFLKLDASGPINKTTDPVMDVRPRITLDITHADGAKDSECGLQALVDSADRIAAHFAEIKTAYEAAGEPKQTFALLLGKTKYASVYINAFRRHGLESVMTAGSLLMSSDEAQTMLALMRLALNKDDELPLFNCLTSELFAISDDALLAFAYSPDINTETNSHKLRGLARGFWKEDALKEWNFNEKEIEAHALAHEILKNLAACARKGKLSDSIRRVLVDSGYIARMNAAGVHGLACVGNYAKLLDILADAEATSFGIAETVEAFEAKVNSVKESPGVLTAEEADFVQIMTIHGSKGLEFDHVAVADFGVKPNSNNNNLAESVGDSLYVFTKKGLGELKKAATLDDDIEAISLDELANQKAIEAIDGALALESTSDIEGKAELRRLLYVAFTRAVKSLYVAYRPSANIIQRGKAVTDAALYEKSMHDGIFHEIYDALKWEIKEGSYTDVISYGAGTGKQLQIQFNYLTPAILEDRREAEAKVVSKEKEQETGDSNEFLVPVYEAPEIPYASPFKGARENVRSYSSLSHDNTSATDDDDSLTGASTNGIAVDLGTAFHRLMQRSIVEAKAAAITTGKMKLYKPSSDALEAQRKELNLTDSQFERLRAAVNNYFSSSIIEELCSYDKLDAEVPFMIQVDGFPNRGGTLKFLEGEIDALATSRNSALIIDYKTGASESSDSLAEKYKLQASCYMCALFQCGYRNVKTIFVRVEHSTEEGELETYAFDAIYSMPLMSKLYETILAHWK